MFLSLWPFWVSQASTHSPRTSRKWIVESIIVQRDRKIREKNMVESAKISIARQDFKKSYERMSSTHLNRNFDGPKKQARVFDTYSTDLQQDQLQTVYKAWYEHSIAMMKTQSETPLCKHYFTMPSFYRTNHYTHLVLDQKNSIYWMNMKQPCHQWMQLYTKIFLMKNP